jgi:hypothetical protein
MNKIRPEPPGLRYKITTLVTHNRNGRSVIAFCPICDHVEEARDDGVGREQTQTVSVAKIQAHIRRRHRSKAAKAGFPGAAQANGPAVN